MVKVKRGNVVLRVADTEAQFYADKGFTVYNIDTNEIIRGASPTAVEDLQKLNEELVQRITTLEDSLAKLTADMNAIKKNNKKKAE